MGYGVVAEYGGEYTLWVPHSGSGYGEVRTDTVDMMDLYNPDVSIHTAIAIVDSTDPGIYNNHSMGIMGYVEDGSYRDFGPTPSDWPTYVYSSNLTFYRVAFHVSLNGGYIKGSHFCQFWGDPNGRDRKPDPPREQRALVVYDNDNVIRHVHHTVRLAGTDTGDYPDADPVQLAYDLGHDSSLALNTAEVDPQQLVGPYMSYDPDRDLVLPPPTP